MTREIDHIVLCRSDLDAMVSLYKKLGFTLTPKADHPFGTGNQLAQLGSDFIELLSVTQPENITPSSPGVFSFGGYNRAFLNKGDGFSMVALKSDGWQADRAHFETQGLDLYEPFEFSRLAGQPDGTEVTVGFKLTIATHPEMPWAIFFTCDHQHEPKYFYKSQFQSHANTAIGIAEVMMVAEDPGLYTSYFEGLIGKNCVTEHDSGLTIDTGSSVINVIRHGELYERFLGAPNISDGDTRMIGYGIHVKDIKTTEKVIQASGLNYQRRGKSLWFSTPETSNVIIEFSETPAVI